MTGDAAAEKDAVGSLLLKMVSCSARKSEMRGAEMLSVGANTMPTVKCQIVGPGLPKIALWERFSAK